MAKISDILRERTYPYAFQEIESLARATGLEYLLEGDTPITLFAPNDYVFNELENVTEFDLLKHIDMLSQLVAYHIVPVRLTMADLRAEARRSGANTLQFQVQSGRLLTVELGEQIQVNGVPVLEEDLLADNGVIHTLGGILLPPGLSLDDFLEPGGSRAATVYDPDELERRWPEGPGA